MAQKRSAKLDPRLAATAALVRPDAIFADIGCDHGYLAIELMRRGAVRGYACDINPGPLASAQKNIEQAGFSAQIQTVLTDGLQGLEQYPITDVTIAGIGGEVITDILKQAAFLKKPSIRLILQPQSREHILRSFLFENGFPIFYEQALRSGRYTYVVFAAEYTGECRKLSLLESYCGMLPEQHTVESKEKLLRTAGFIKDIAEGLSHRGNAEEAAQLLTVYQQILTITDNLLNN